MVWMIIGGPENVTYPPSTSSVSWRYRLQTRDGREMTTTFAIANISQTPRGNLNSATPSNPADEPSCSTASWPRAGHPRGSWSTASASTLAPTNKSERKGRGRWPLRGIRPPEPCLCATTSLAVPGSSMCEVGQTVYASRSQGAIGASLGRIARNCCATARTRSRNRASSSPTMGSLGDVISDVSEG